MSYFFEPSDYYSCKELFESFSNSSTIFLLSHALIDCEELISTKSENQSYSVASINTLNFLSSSATVYQVHSAVAIIMKTFSLDTYAIIKDVRSNSIRGSYLSEFANQFQYLVTQKNEFILKFGISVQDLNMENLILKYASSTKGNLFYLCVVSV